MLPMGKVACSLSLVHVDSSCSGKLKQPRAVLEDEGEGPGLLFHLPGHAVHQGGGGELASR